MTFVGLFLVIHWESRQVAIRLPKFKLETGSLSLAEALETMGMESAFDRPNGSADFSRIATRSATNGRYIGRIFQKTLLEADESGSVAASANYIAFTERGGFPEAVKTVEVKVDHPFLFLIQHVQSGACLFLGHVADPR